MESKRKKETEMNLLPKKKTVTDTETKLMVTKVGWEEG